ncbi:MAG: DUF4870 domain-containing protein [Pirellula sp.]|nr:DUF4870 domain-containing protein [Pirellula sp.]
MESRTWAMLLHLSVFLGYVIPLGGLIAPILIWQLKKEQFPDLDQHGKMVVNFIISMLIYSAIAFILTFVLIGIFVGIALMIIGVAYPIIGAIKANNGEFWKYPLILQLLK